MPVPADISLLSTTAASNSPGSGESPGAGDDHIRALAAIIKQNASSGSDIASANSITIPNAGSYFAVTGTTTITSIADAWNGRMVALKFSGALTLTHSASFILPGGANITTASGDVGLFVNESTGVWRCVSYHAVAVGPTEAKSGPGSTPINLRNKVINGDFSVNQRAVSGTVTLAAGAYGHDRWKAGASGCTYTFAASNGLTTITITAGSLQQVIEDKNVPAGTNTMVMSWTGTAQGKIGAGSYGASGVTASVTGGSNLTVEFGTGTLTKVQIELGSTPTPFGERPYGMELILCQRYYATQRMRLHASLGTDIHPIYFPVTMRATPTMSVTPDSGSGAVLFALDGYSAYQSTQNSVFANGTWTASAEL